MDPSLFVSVDTGEAGKDKRKNKKPGSNDFPGSAENQRRRVVGGVLLEMSKNRHDGHEGSSSSSLSRDYVEEIEEGEDDGGFLMPSVIPTNNDDPSSRSRKKLRPEAAATEFGSLDVALAGVAKSRFTGRLGDTNIATHGNLLNTKRSKADIAKELLADLSQALAQCERCHAPLATFFGSDQSYDELLALYQKAVRKAPTAPKSALLPKVWCPSCVPQLKGLQCPICDRTTIAAVNENVAAAGSKNEMARMPMVRCIRCFSSYHGKCLGMDEETSLALAALLPTGGDVQASHIPYCCPKCTLATASVRVEKKTRASRKGRF
eukprot:GILI01038844.1.p1 GENE.GILI01038844.1~~GILI01038844.1.p1  ORF type:complete len:321 (+),score=55.38 GILI01038844.1:30-992(+)